jgi:Zn-dependent M28 family amino/carboxypeptidase
MVAGAGDGLEDPWQPDSRNRIMHVPATQNGFSLVIFFAPEKRY